MNASEKAVLKSIVENLTNSTETKWTEGGLEKWADWAKKMRTTILTSTKILDSLLKVDEPEKPTEKLTETKLEKPIKPESQIIKEGDIPHFDAK